MIEEYSDRMITRERFVREGSRMIVERWYVAWPEKSRGRAPEPQRAERSDASSEDGAADATSKDR